MVTYIFCITSLDALDVYLECQVFKLVNM